MFVLKVILGLVFCIGTFLWWWQRSARLYWEKKGVSYIPGPPLIGALKDSLLLKTSFGQLFMNFYNHEKFKDDPFTGLYFFHKPCLFVRDPEIIKTILIKDSTSFMDRGVSSDPINDVIGMDNLFAVKGQRWKTIRHKLTPLFTTGKLKNLFLLMGNVAKILDQKLAMEIGDEPQEYEMKKLASTFTIDTIAICAFGVQANSLLNDKVDFYIKANKTFQLNWIRAIEVATCFFIPVLAPLLHSKIFSNETNEFLRSTINYVMEERIKSGTKRNDLIDVLIDLNREDASFKGDTLVAQAAIFLTAGYETPSGAISFALYELARQPDIQDKVREEIKDYFEKYESVTYETINEMDYLDCVVQEILRLYPLLPFLDRVCNPENGENSYSLEPYHRFAIPRGMNVYISSLSIQRDPKFFPNPLDFIPERFNSENRHLINQYNYLPLGLGPRNCIGSRFGILQVKLALVTILRKYKIEATERTPKSIEFDKKVLILHSKAPLYMNLRKI